MAVCQSEYLVLIHRYREQAPSHIKTQKKTPRTSRGVFATD